ncbi:uncharacterized protein [Amphiura filiformis]|uniref:uncharacterized protein n=1 Tax=Amphiura filiformis TaxID=82378 RepID=UPI003B21D93F
MADSDYASPTEGTPGTSEHQDEIPGTSQHQDEIPGTSQHQYEIPGTSQHQGEMQATEIKPKKLRKSKKGKHKSKESKRKSRKSKTKENKLAEFEDKSTKRKRKEQKLDKSDEEKSRKRKKEQKLPDFDQNSKERKEHKSSKSEKKSWKRKGEEQDSPHLPKSQCCKRRCIHNIELNIRETLLREYHEQQNISVKNGQTYLCRYISHSEARKINGKQRNSTYYYNIPAGDGGEMRYICQKAFRQIFDMDTDCALRYARRQLDGSKIKQEPEEEEDVILIETVPRSSDSNRCHCINSTPVHFNAPACNTLQEFQRMTNWYLYRITGDTLQALFDQRYNSVISLQSIAEEDLQSFVHLHRAQISLLRRFMQSLNCQQHPPVYPRPRSEVPVEVPGVPLSTATRRPAAATISTLPSEPLNGNLRDSVNPSRVAIETTRQNQKMPGEDSSQISESAMSPVDMQVHPSPPVSAITEPNIQPVEPLDGESQPYQPSYVQPQHPESPCDYLNVESPYACYLLKMYSSPSPSQAPESPSTAAQSQQKNGQIVSETLPVLSPGGLTEILDGSPKPNSQQQQPYGREDEIFFSAYENIPRIPSVSLTPISRPASASSTKSLLPQDLQNTSPREHLNSPSPGVMSQSLSPRIMLSSPSPAPRLESASSIRSLHTPDLQCVSPGTNAKQRIKTTARKVGPCAPRRVLAHICGYRSKLIGINKTLCIACITGNITEVSKCLHQRADINSKYDWDGNPPLHLAAMYGHQEVCDVLLKAGADVHGKNNGGKTPLHLASLDGHQEVCDVLLKAGADVHSKNNDEDTPLHGAAMRGHEEVCDVLLKALADVHSKNNYGVTPLHIAAWNGHHEVCDVLLKAGADVHSKDNDGETPLNLASLDGHQEVCDVLLKAGADVHSKNNVCITNHVDRNKRHFKSICLTLLLVTNYNHNYMCDSVFNVLYRVFQNRSLIVSLVFSYLRKIDSHKSIFYLKNFFQISKI